jgi:hypothetical protein
MSVCSSLVFNFLVNYRAIVNEKSSISISVFNSHHQLMEAVKEFESPLWHEQDSSRTDLMVFWGYTWHMQTPLDNLEPGSLLIIEYKSPAVNHNSFSVSTMCTIDLDVATIDSGEKTISLTSSSDIGKQQNPVFAQNDKSTLNIDFVVNRKNGAIDYRSIFGM